MINVAYQEQNIGMKNLNTVLFRDDLIAQLAKLLVGDHVECFLDMAYDMPDAPQNYTETKQYMQGVKASLVEGVLPDLLADFRYALYKAINEVQIDLKSVTVSENGIEDIVVEIN